MICSYLGYIHVFLPSVVNSLCLHQYIFLGIKIVLFNETMLGS